MPFKRCKEEGGAKNKVLLPKCAIDFLEIQPN